MPEDWPQQLREDDLVLDSLPEEVETTVQARDAWFRELSRESDGLEFIVSDLRRWNPGQRVRVAFYGGDNALHRDIADAIREITDNCNLVLDFGDTQNNTFRTWSPQDTEHAAEIRVSFDQAGYFSLVGTDSIAPNIGTPVGAVGGRPGQRSLNLGGFSVDRPPNWQGVVRHEFLHALGFLHSHQNMRGPCEQAFRWDDDEGYQPTKDAQGRFIVDSAQRRPGIYTYLSGYPNGWKKDKVDHNLRTEDDPETVAGPFDRRSVMLYRFPALFYKTVPSECAPEGDGISLSEGDRRGLQLLYPSIDAAETIMERRRALARAVESIEAEPGLESPGEAASAMQARSVARVLGTLVQAT